MEKLKIMEWNIRGSASLGWNNNKRIEKDVVDKIIKHKDKADILVLTEFVVLSGVEYLFEKLKENDYIWFMSYETGGNGLLIAVKEKLISLDATITNTLYRNAVYSRRKDCNILYVKIPLKNHMDMSIVGCRMEMETGNDKELEKIYNAKRTVFDKVLLPILKEDKSSVCIVCGDFNNAQCHGDLNKKFKIEDYFGMAQINYNLNYIKDSFNEIGFTMIDVDKNGKAIPTHKCFPIDHIFVHGLEIIDTNCKSVSVDNLSDHNILFAELKFDNDFF